MDSRKADGRKGRGQIGVGEGCDERFSQSPDDFVGQAGRGNERQA